MFLWLVWRVVSLHLVRASWWLLLFSIYFKNAAQSFLSHSSCSRSFIWATRHPFRSIPFLVLEGKAKPQVETSTKPSHPITTTTTSWSHNDDSLEVLLPILHEYSYDRRLLTISNSQLPVLAEIYHQGQCQLCRINSFHLSAFKDPRVEVQCIIPDNSNNRRFGQINNQTTTTAIIDVGQITTIWQVDHNSYVYNTTWFKGWDDDAENRQQRRQSPASQKWQLERSLDQLYHSHVGRARSSATGLAKKDLGKNILMNIPEEYRSRVETVLRHLRKAGNGLSRLIDSSAAVSFLYQSPSPRAHQALQRQAVAAGALAKDAEEGGRFKRMSCVLVAHQVIADPKDISINKVKSITIINGGWLVLDQSVRAGAEARKLVDRFEKQQSGFRLGLKLTAADERILQRLECLAMGDVFSWSNNDERRDDDPKEKKLEVDVQETLKTLDFPATAEGAKKALVAIGRWTQDPGSISLNPWSRDVLDAARWYAATVKRRWRDGLQAHGGKLSSSSLEGRVDLTMLPCVSIDAARTSFRDDAIGLRLRSSTGRPVFNASSKWEVLIHIADVSDIFSLSPVLLDYEPKVTPKDARLLQQGHLQLLRDAAASRGTSRYDLPLGPLHLIPPIALEALSLRTINVVGLTEGVDRRTCGNRCVSIWAYIDVQSGRLLDIGMERTMIAIPTALSFVEATELLLPSALSSASEPTTRQASSILQVANRILLKWSMRHQQQNNAASEREKRLVMKELVSREIKPNARHDDGRDGFLRTPGHRVVDAAVDLYSHALSALLRGVKAPIPRSAGSGESRGGRLGTAPLRRYIDAIAQRQALAVLCSYGGPPLSRSQCLEVGKVATNARNNLANIYSFKADATQILNQSKQQPKALQLLKAQLGTSSRPFQAIGTGRENEVVLVGFGVVAKCLGVDGSLAPGDRVVVRVVPKDLEEGSISVRFVDFVID